MPTAIRMQYVYAMAYKLIYENMSLNWNFIPIWDALIVFIKVENYNIYNEKTKY